MLRQIDDFDQLAAVKSFPSAEVSEALIATVRTLHETEELEPALREALYDPNLTPHGPAEFADILTHRASIRGRTGLAAFVIKGRSSQTVRQADISHQVYRLRKIGGLDFAVLAVVGNILDPAKEEFVSTATDIGCDYAIFDANDIARLMVAKGHLCPRDGTRIRRGRCECGYRPHAAELNPLQEEALREARTIGEGAGLVVMPTGSGKTRVAARDALAAGARSILYVAHHREILWGAYGELGAVLGARSVKMVTGAEHIGCRARARLATIQLLRLHLDSLREAPPDYLVIDEFHRAAAQSYRDLVATVRPRFLLGLTATPFRVDQQDVLELCGGNLVVDFQLREGIDSGILSPYDYHGCLDTVDYNKVHHDGRRYSVRDLDRQLVVPERYEAIVGKWLELAEDKATIAFCRTQAHARRTADEFCARGIAAECYLATTNSQERQAIQRRLQQGETRVLCSVDVLTEGADLPFVECLLFLRPTESKRVFLQQLGRGLRQFPGKHILTVIDFIANFKNAYLIVEYHGLLPYEHEAEGLGRSRPHTIREVLNLPLGCRVQFDDRVIHIFEEQVYRRGRITRHNIEGVLWYHYRRLCKAQGRLCNRRDLDHTLLDSKFYADVFGTWPAFQAMAAADPELAAYVSAGPAQREAP